jgi:hypothetical protein
MTKKSLIVLLNHPQVKKKLDLGKLLGLSGHTQTDYAIGVIENVIAELEEGKVVTSSLKKEYGLLRVDPKYKQYFLKITKKSLNPEDRYKSPAYKAINGF